MSESTTLLIYSIGIVIKLIRKGKEEGKDWIIGGNNLSPTLVEDQGRG